MTDVVFAVVIGFILGLLAGYYLNQGSLGFDIRPDRHDQEEQ